MRIRDLIRYLEDLTVTQGECAGEPLRLFPWERRFIRNAFPRTGDTALSIARGNGKSTLLAGVATAFVDGPLRQPRAEVVVVASSFAQGKICFDHAKAFLGDKLDRKDEWRVMDSDQAATIEHRPTGAKMRTLGCDPRRAHGLAPSLVLCDEPAQWEHTKSERMLAALATALGKIPGSRMIALGTRPEDSEHWFQKMLSGGCEYAQSHHADPDDPPFQRRTWRKANPSLAYMPSLLARIECEAREARTDPLKLAAFKALRLNLGVADVAQSYLIEPGEWQRIEQMNQDRFGPCVWGVDLGTSAAMSAVACYWPEGGALDALACFPKIPDLKERGLRDGVGRAYQLMQDRCELMVSGNRISDVRALLREARERFGKPALVVADRWREAELVDALEAEKFACELETRGMGFLDGAADVRSFRAACLTDKVHPVKSLLLTAAVSEARTVSDPAGNEKLSKGVQGGRRMRAKDDAAAAAILAVAAGHRHFQDRPKRRVYLGAV